MKTNNQTNNYSIFFLNLQNQMLGVGVFNTTHNVLRFRFGQLNRRRALEQRTVRRKLRNSVQLLNVNVLTSGCRWQTDCGCIGCASRCRTRTTDIQLSVRRNHPLFNYRRQRNGFQIEWLVGWLLHVLQQRFF